MWDKLGMRRRAAMVGAVACLLATAAGCTSGTVTPAASDPPGTATVAAPTTTPTAPASAAPTTSAPRPRPRRTTPPVPASTSSSPTSSSPTSSTPTPSDAASSSPVAVPTGGRPVIVIDPGHSPTVHATDPRTGLDVSDYENEPEMTDVFAVAKLVQAQLEAAGYRVYLTKKTADQSESLGARADLANRVHADLALSIHDQAGSNGGIGFNSGNNIVYYQSVGTYRETPTGQKIYFTNQRLADVSKKYGQIFDTERSEYEGHSITLQDNVGYNLGSRGLAAGNIWIVQLLSNVPWIYNEAGGNSAGMSGLDSADKQKYANGLVESVEHCIAPPR